MFRCIAANVQFRFKADSRYVGHDMIHVGSGTLFLELVSFRGADIDSYQHVFEIGVDSERCFQLLGNVRKLYVSVGWKHSFLSTLHITLPFLHVEQVLSRESVYAETAEEVCMFPTGN